MGFGTSIVQSRLGWCTACHTSVCWGNVPALLGLCSLQLWTLRSQHFPVCFPSWSKQALVVFTVALEPWHCPAMPSQQPRASSGLGSGCLEPLSPLGLHCQDPGSCPAQPQTHPMHCLTQKTECGPHPAFPEWPRPACPLTRPQGWAGWDTGDGCCSGSRADGKAVLSVF